MSDHGRSRPDQDDVDRVEKAVDEPVEGQGSGGPSTRPEVARPDRDAPGTYVDDVTSPEVAEPNEPA